LTGLHLASCIPSAENFSIAEKALQGVMHLLGREWLLHSGTPEQQ